MQMQSLQLAPNSLKIIHRYILNTKWITITGENIEENQHELVFGHVDHELWALTHNTKKQSREINKEYDGLYKVKDFDSVKDLIQKVKRQVTNWEKKSCKHICGKNLSQNKKQ